MAQRNRRLSDVEVVETPAIHTPTTYDREEGTLNLSGRRNDASNLNSIERSGADVFTMHRKGGLLAIGTWNVRTLHQLGKLENAIVEMEKHKLNMMGVGEMRWTGSGSTNKDGYLVLFSGGDTHTAGVGMIIDKKYAAGVMGFLPISNRVMIVKIEGKPFNLAVIQAYAPTSDHSEEDIEQFYEDMEKAHQQVKSTDILVVMGDMNAKIGKGKVENYVGEYGLGTRNERGERLLEYVIEKDLTIANTNFQQPSRRLYTWKSPGDVFRNQIDYIMTRRRYRNSVKDCRTYPGADINSDHCLLVSRMNFRLKKIKKKEMKDQYDLEILKQENIQKRYAVEVVNRFTILSQEEPPQEETEVEGVDRKWNNFKESIHKTTKDLVRKTERKRHKEWMTGDILKLIEERSKLKETAEYNRKDKEIKAACREAKEKWFNDRCDEMLLLEKNHNSKEMHAKVKEAIGAKKQRTKLQECIKDKDGNILFETSLIEERWKEYIQDLYDDKDRPEEMHTDSTEGPAILVSEVKYAMKNMKNRKAPGRDEITIEQLKALNEEGLKILTNICNEVYRTGHIPEDLRHSIFVKIPKKANAVDCTDYRTLCLMSNITKIVLRVITERNRRIFEREAGRTQSGFKKGMGTREGIFNFRIIVEKLLEKNKKIYICFIDYKKAFDRVFHMKLIDALNKLEIDGKDLTLIKNLYWNQTASIRTEDGYSGSFPIKRGVRQGCVLSPHLFNVYTEIIFRDFDDIPGVNLSGEYINNLRYADDTVLIAESEEELQKLVDAVKEGSRVYGLEMNTKKTKTMVVRRDPNDGSRVNIKVDGVTLEQVESYQYLGQIITEDGRCENEIRRRIGIAKTNFLKMKDVLITKKLSMEIRKKILHCYIMSTLMYAAETWVINLADWKRLEAFELWALRKMMKVSWKDKKTNEEVMKRAKCKRSLKENIMKRKARYLGHVLRRNGLQRQLLDATTEGSRGRGRPRHTWIHHAKKDLNMTYVQIVRSVQDRQLFRRTVEEMISS